jgi:hypothetical protein
MEMEQGLSHICKYAESLIVQVVTSSLRHGKYEFHIDVQLYLPTCLPACLGSLCGPQFTSGSQDECVG